MKVALFSGGKNDPASRFRYRQNISRLEKIGINITDYQAYVSQYAGSNKYRRPIWALNELTHRHKQIRESNTSDIAIIQREFLASLSTLELKIKSPKIFDFDDAIYLRQRFNGVDRILRNVDGVFCGNNVIAEYARKFNENVFIINTPVDTDRFVPRNNKKTDQIVIGWSGTSGNYHSLYSIEEVLSQILKISDNVKLLISSNAPPKFKLITDDKIHYIPWSPENEVEVFQMMDIGIMPLEDTPWNRGKCAYKMLLYLSCGIPVVVSPVGMNAEIFEYGNIGYPAKSTSDWADALFTLVEDEKLRKEYGDQGRKLVVNRYSSEVIVSKIEQSLNDVINRCIL